MSRGFLGGGGKKGGGKKNSRGADMIARMQRLSTFASGSKKDIMESKQSHKMKSSSEILDDMLDEKMFNPGHKKGGFHLPGTKPPEEREMTKGQKMAAEMAYAKKMKKRMKLRAAKVEIQPKSFGDGPHGGRIAKDGKIMNNQGRVLFRVDPNTGIISDNFGKRVGKYNPKSLSLDFKIEGLIKRYSQQADVTNPFAPKE